MKKPDHVVFRSPFLDFAFILVWGPFVSFLIRNKINLLSPFFIGWLILSTCYPLGKFFQYRLIGPRFIRWYLADVGFVPWCTYFIAVVILFLGLSFPTWTYGGATFCWILAISLELREMRARIGGEWKDIIIFTTTYLIMLILLFCINHYPVLLIS